MTDKHLLPQIAEDEINSMDNEIDVTTNLKVMSRAELEDYNKILEDQVKLLKDRLNQVENVSYPVNRI